MERIQRALERARHERAQLAGGVAAAPVAAAVATASVAALPPTPIVTAPIREIPVAEPAAATELRRVRLDRAELERRHVVVPTEASPAASAYRMLRTQLLQRIRGTRERVIGIVSAADGEGKTLTATNLALSLAAEPNHTVLLLDLDLRNPGLAPLLGLNTTRGLDSWFADGRGLDDICVGIEGIDRLLLLPTLHPVPNSSDVLAGPRTAQLINDLKGRHQDRILIVDLPPALLANDLLTVAPHLDGVLLVACEGRTRRDDLVRMKEMLSPLRVLGTVLNNSSESEKRAY